MTNPLNPPMAKPLKAEHEERAWFWCPTCGRHGSRALSAIKPASVFECTGWGIDRHDPAVMIGAGHGWAGAKKATIEGKAIRRALLG